jgi:hypothetical protein
MASGEMPRGFRNALFPTEFYRERAVETQKHRYQNRSASPTIDGDTGKVAVTIHMKFPWTPVSLRRDDNSCFNGKDM